MKKLLFLFIFLISGFAFSQTKSSIRSNKEVKNEVINARPPGDFIIEDPIDIDPIDIDPIDGDPIDIDPVDSDPVTTLSPPIETTEVGYTNGELSVSGTGGAVYSIPIALPPGINNVAPNISLNYSSQSGDGYAGYGWNISGVSKITRVPSTLYHDGIIDPVDFDNYDRFTLDGQRLILKSGTYGSTGSTYETENFSNLKVTLLSNSGLEFFKVEYSDGSIANYGIDSNSNNQISFYISEWKNPQGISINYNYIKENNFSYISTIKYGSLNNADHFNTILFNYKNRSVNQRSFIFNINIVNSKVLSSIFISCNNIGYKNYYLNHINNQLGYDFLKSIIEKTGDNSKSLLPINFNNDFTNTTLIKSNNYFWMENSLDPFNPTHFIEHGGFVSSDFDNDKKTDLIGYSAVRRKETYRFLTNPYPESYKFVYVPNISKGQSYYNSFLKQMNNPIESISIVNLLKDIGTSGYELSSTNAWCVASNNFNSNTVFFDIFSKTNSGENLEYQKTFNYPVGCIDSNGSETKPYYDYFYGDFNGDKLTDVIAVNRNNYFNISPAPGVQQVANCSQPNIQNGATFFIDLDKRKTNDYTNFSGNIGYCKNDVGYDVDYTKKVTILSGDVNNDGKTDLISIKNYQSNAFYSGHRSVEVFSLDENNNLVSIGITNLTHNFNKVISGDFNGDGQTDLIFDAFDGYIYTWSGNQFVFTGVKTYPLRFLNFVGDLNNDGKTDLLFYGNLSYPSHNAILTVFGYDVMMGKYKTLTNNNQIASQFLIEDDVSGNMTLVGISNSIKFTEFTNDMSKDKLVTSIKNGAVEDFITYESNENVYNISNNNDIKFPNYCIPKNSNLKFVSQIRKEFNGYSKKQKFKYNNYIVSFNDMSFKGFQATTVTNWFNDPSTIISTVNKFDFSKNGAIKETFSKLGLIEPNYSLLPSDDFIARSVNTYNHEDTSYIDPLLSNKVFKLFKTKSENFNGQNNTSSITTVNYNTYNNPINSTTVIKNGGTVEKTTTNTFGYDGVITTPYIVDRLNNKVSTTTLATTGDVHSSEEQYTYDSNLLKQIKKRSTNSGLTSDFITENNEYDAYGNVIQKKYSAPGMADRMVNYEYDAATHRFLVKKIDPELQQTVYTYNQSTGLLLTETLPSIAGFPLTTTYSYDLWGKVIAVKDYLNKIVSYSYFNLSTGGVLKTITGPDGGSSKIIYDPLGRTLHEGYKNLNEQWSVKSTLYNIYDQPLKVYKNYLDGNTPEVWDELQYDVYGRLTQANHLKSISSAGKTVTYTYNGLTTTENDGLKIKTTINNASGQVISLNDNPGETITYDYFANGNLKKAYLNGGVLEIQQDAFGRRKTLIDPSAGTRNYEYNKFGELTKEEVVGKGETEFDLDNNGKLLQKRIKELGVLKSSDTYTYNSNKQLASNLFEDLANSTQINYTYTYDNYKRLLLNSEDAAQYYFKQELRYDAFGRTEKQLYHAKNKSDNKISDKWIKYEYKFGNKYKVYDMINESTQGIVLWEAKNVDKDGNVILGNLNNGALKVEKTFDMYGFPTQSKYSKGLVNLATLDTEFDPIYGNLTKRTSNLFGSTWTENLSYDALDRLTTWKDHEGIQNQSYNDNGTIDTNKIGDYAYTISNKPFQVSTVTPVVPSAIFDYYANREQNITYNVNKKPLTIKELTAENIDFEYNGFDSRSVMYYGGLQPLKADRPFRKYYSADGSMEIKRNITSGTVEFYTYIGGSPYSSSIVLKSNGTTKEYLYLLKDYQETINAIVNQSGTVIEKRQFDVWGTLIQYANASGITTIPTTANGLMLDRGYTSHEHLLGVNIINMNGRVYDHHLHKFLQPDNNIQDFYNTQNYNRYGYVMNNPTKYTDESGEFWGYIIGALFNAYAAGYNSSGDYNPFKWDNIAWTNAGLGAASFAASAGATYYADNYISNYGNNNVVVDDEDTGLNIEDTSIEIWVSEVIWETAHEIFGDNYISTVNPNLAVEQNGAIFEPLENTLNSIISFADNPIAFVCSVFDNAATTVAGIASGDSKKTASAVVFIAPLFINPEAGLAESSTAKVALSTGSRGGLNLFKFRAGQTEMISGWKTGDYMLNLPNKGTPKLNWKANYGELRREMSFGNPIYDSYRMPNGNLIPTGGFLNAERFTLQSRGWIYNPITGAWMPPLK